MYQVILYGIAGADQQYIAQMYYCLYEEEISIYNIMYQARMLKAKCPSIEHVMDADDVMTNVKALRLLNRMCDLCCAMFEKQDKLMDKMGKAMDKYLTEDKKK